MGKVMCCAFHCPYVYTAYCGISDDTICGFHHSTVNKYAKNLYHNHDLSIPFLWQYKHRKPSSSPLELVSLEYNTTPVKMIVNGEWKEMSISTSSSKEDDDDVLYVHGICLWIKYEF